MKNLSNLSYILLSIIIFALFLRIFALFNLKETVYFHFLIYDERIFHEWAVKIADGKFHLKEVYPFAPLFPYLMAGVYKLFSADILYIRVLNIFFGTITCYLVYLIGKTLSGEKTGIASCLIAAIYIPFIWFSIVPLKAMLSTCIFGALIFYFLMLIRYPSIFGIFMCGVFLGLLLNLRPQMMIFLPILPGLILRYHFKTKAKKIWIVLMLVYFAGFVLTISPFVIRNYMQTGTIALTTSQSGFNLYRATKLDFPVPVSFAVTDPSKQEIQFAIEASRRLGKKLDRKEASEYWQKKSLEILLTHPLDSLKLFCLKIIIFFQQHQMTDHYHLDFMNRYIDVLKLPFPTFQLIMPFAMAGLILMGFQKKEITSLLFVFLAYTATMAVLFVRTRYRLPLMVFLIPVAIIGVNFFIQAIRKKTYRQAAMYLCVLSIFIIIGCLPVQDSDDITAYLNGHALALSAQGRKKEAVDTWEESSDMKGLYSDFANLSLAGHYLQNQNYKESKKYLDRIPDSSYAVAQKYLLHGEMMLFQGKLVEAANAYETSLVHNSGQMLPLRRLVKIYFHTDREKSYKTYHRLKYVESFYEVNQE